MNNTRNRSNVQIMKGFKRRNEAGDLITGKQFRPILGAGFIHAEEAGKLAVFPNFRGNLRKSLRGSYAKGVRVPDFIHYPVKLFARFRGE